MIKQTIAALSAFFSIGVFAAQAASATVVASAPQLAASAITTVASTSPGIFTAVFAFIVGLLLTWPALIALVGIGILLEHNEARGTAIFIALLLSVISFFFFHVSLVSIAIYTVGYLIFGLLWSFYRYKRHTSNMVEKHQESSQSTKDRVIAELHPMAMLSTISAWILVWPFSLVENFIGDILDNIKLLVSKVFRGVYHRIYDSAVSQLTK